jgi:hypothetical protein
MAWWPGPITLEVHVCHDVVDWYFSGRHLIPRNQPRNFGWNMVIKFFFFVVVMCDLARWKLAKTQKKDHGGRWRPPSSHEGCGASRPAPRHTTDSPHIALRAYVVKTKKILFLLLIIAILVAARCQKVLPVRHQMWWLFGQSRASTAAAVAHIHSIWSP